MAHGQFSRLHLFKSQDHYEIVENIVSKALQYIGIQLKILKSQITLEKFQRDRFGKYRYVN